MSKNTTNETARKLMDMIAESAAREERQRAEISAALAEATQAWLATLSEQGRTDFFVSIEAVASLAAARKLAKHRDRPAAVDALAAKAREAEMRQKDADRQRKLQEAEARDLARLAALREKYGGAVTSKSTGAKDPSAA